MSATYTPQQAFDYAKRFLKGMPLEQVQTQILTDASSMMWMAAPWRWSVAALPKFALTSNTQDYTVALPADFLFIQNAYSSDETNNIPRIYHVDGFLPPGGKVGIPSRLALVSGTAGNPGTIRLSPKPTTLPATPWEIISLYKKQAPIITNKTLNTVGSLIFDDEWFHVYVSGVLYFGYLFGDDQRAGGAQIDPSSGRVQFTGQRGVFEANLMIMKQRERLGGMDTTAPETKDTGN